MRATIVATILHFQSPNIRSWACAQIFQAWVLSGRTIAARPWPFVYTAIGGEETWPHWWLVWLKLRVRA